MNAEHTRTELPRELGRNSLVYAALSGLAVAQPMYDLVERNVDAVNPSRVTNLDLAVFALGVVLVPTAVLVLLDLLLGTVLPRYRRVIFGVLCGGMTTLFAWEAIKRYTDIPSRFIILGGLAAGCVLAFCVVRFPAARSWLRYLAVAVPVFALLFFFSPAVTKLRDANSVTGSGSSATRPHRIVMLVADELPMESLLGADGQIDATRYPNLAALAGDGTWYRNATTVASFTQRAVPAIVSSELPDGTNALPGAGVYPRTLFSALPDSYTMNVHEAAEALCARGVCSDSEWSGISNGPGLRGLTRTALMSFEEFVSPIRGTAPSLYRDTEDRSLRAGRRFASTIRRRSSPTFDYLHVVLPHQPWNHYGTGQSVGAGPPQNYGKWRDRTDADLAQQRHFLQLQVLDHIVGSVRNRLQRIGEYDRSIIVLTADHGVAFQAGTFTRRAVDDNASAIAWVPLVIKESDQREGVVSDRAASTLDIVPTVLESIGVNPPWRLAGNALQRAASPPKPVVVVNGDWRKVVTVRNGMIRRFDRASGFMRAISARPSWISPTSANLYEYGPYGAALGRPLSQIVGEPAPVRVRVGSVDAPVTPWAYLTLATDGALGAPVGVTVNGRLAGFSTVTQGVGKRTRIRISLDPTSFENGSNTVAAFTLSGTADAPVGRALRVTRVANAAPGAVIGSEH